eukprot:7378059-Prymnesium_polylepis.1
MVHLHTCLEDGDGRAGLLAKQLGADQLVEDLVNRRVETDRDGLPLQQVDDQALHPFPQLLHGVQPAGDRAGRVLPSELSKRSLAVVRGVDRRLAR